MPKMINLGSDISCQREQKPSSLGLCRVQPKSDDSQMLRINPKDNKKLEYSTNKGLSWHPRFGGNSGLLNQFKAKMTLESLRSSGLFTYHSADRDVRESLSDELTLQVRAKLSQYISPVEGQSLEWKDANGHRHFDFLYQGVKHTFYYTFDDHITMGVYLDGQIVTTEVFDYDNPQKEMELFAEMWLLQANLA